MSQSANVVWSEGSVERTVRWEKLGHRGATLWFTGLPASGKSTISAALELALVERGIPAYRLDGDNIRHGLNSNLGFSAEDRAENIRRIGEVAKLFADAGVVAVTAFISPYRADRERSRALHQAAELPFFEVHVDAPLKVCEARDPKGMYKKARAGQLKGFTGVDAPYEVPSKPDLVLKTHEQDVAACVVACVELLTRAGVIAGASR